MARKSRFDEPCGQRRYRGRFVVAREGETERQYLRNLSEIRHSKIHIDCFKRGRASSPPRILRDMEDHLTHKPFSHRDEAWLVVDKDEWTDKQLKPLHNWSRQHDNRGFALSNPSFEYWLLLHFEEGAGIESPKDCIRRLKKYLPNYNKKIVPGEFTVERIKKAIERARLRDQPPCIDWPREPGRTTVYKLVEKLLGQG